MPITDWPEGDRPREKLLKFGPQHLSDTELLAIFYRTGISGKTAVDLARETLHHFGSLRALLTSGIEEFCKVPGLGLAKYAQLQASTELSKRCFFEEIPKQGALTSPQATRQYLLSRMRDYPYEVFATLFLDNQHRIIKMEELFRGSISSASVYPREVVRQVIKHNAAAVIFVHNHPSGIAEPSQSDKAITDTLTKALNLLDVRVLDHLIIGSCEVVSMAERGLL
jgi:DNA repair protein RadC